MMPERRMKLVKKWMYTLIALFLLLTLACAGCGADALPASGPDWISIRGSRAYGQFSQAGVPDGFVVMESKKETTYGLMNNAVPDRNCWNGTCVYFVRGEEDAIHTVGILQCTDGWVHHALRFYLDGRISFMDLTTSHGILCQNDDGKYTLSEERNNRWQAAQLISRQDIPVWVEDLFYTDVTFTIEEKRDGTLHYGSYAIDAVSEDGSPVSLLAMRVEPDGSVNIRWKDRHWSYDTKRNEYHPEPEPSWIVQTSEDLRRCLEAADAGDAAAQYAAGQAYLEGEIAEQDSSRAMEYLLRAAEQENVDALAALGRMYLNGAGVPKDEETAASYYGRAAEKGNAEALYFVGSRIDPAVHGESGETALDCFRRAAEQLYPEALYRMAKLYEAGTLVHKNPLAARLYLIAAAKRGVDEAQYPVGIMYYRGDGVEENHGLARPYLERAAELGKADAQYYVGMMYYFGRGAEYSPETAARYFSLAAEQGDMFAQDWLGNMYLSGTGVEQSYTQAEYYFTLSADQGLGLAAESLGDLYSDESSGLANRDAALRYYQLAVELGQKTARRKLDALTSE